jgi:hypothetical protein
MISAEPKVQMPNVSLEQTSRDGQNWVLVAMRGSSAQNR